jgi:hypothetical protein
MTPKFTATKGLYEKNLKFKLFARKT